MRRLIDGNDKIASNIAAVRKLRFTQEMRPVIDTLSELIVSMMIQHGMPSTSRDAKVPLRSP